MRYPRESPWWGEELLQGPPAASICIPGAAPPIGDPGERVGCPYVHPESALRASPGRSWQSSGQAPSRRFRCLCSRRRSSLVTLSGRTLEWQPNWPSGRPISSVDLTAVRHGQGPLWDAASLRGLPPPTAALDRSGAMVDRGPCDAAGYGRDRRSIRAVEVGALTD